MPSGSTSKAWSVAAIFFPSLAVCSANASVCTSSSSGRSSRAGSAQGAGLPPGRLNYQDWPSPHLPFPPAFLLTYFLLQGSHSFPSLFYSKGLFQALCRSVPLLPRFGEGRAGSAAQHSARSGGWGHEMLLEEPLKQLLTISCKDLAHQHSLKSALSPQGGFPGSPHQHCLSGSPCLGHTRGHAHLAGLY